MNDLEVTKLCAKAMGHATVCNQWNEKTKWHTWTVQIEMREGGWTQYDPLHDDAQAMALVKRFGLWIAYGRRSEENGLSACMWRVGERASGPYVWDDDLNHAICLCVAALQSSKPEG